MVVACCQPGGSAKGVTEEARGAEVGRRSMWLGLVRFYILRTSDRLMGSTRKGGAT